MPKENTTPTKSAIVAECNLYLSPGRYKLPPGSLKKISLKFGCPPRTIQRFRQQYRRNLSNTDLTSREIPLLKRQRVGNCGRKSILTDNIRQNIITIAQRYANNLIYLSKRSMV